MNGYGNIQKRLNMFAPEPELKENITPALLGAASGAASAMLGTRGGRGVNTGQMIRKGLTRGLLGGAGGFAQSLGDLYGRDLQRREELKDKMLEPYLDPFEREQQKAMAELYKTRAEAEKLKPKRWDMKAQAEEKKRNQERLRDLRKQERDILKSIYRPKTGTLGSIDPSLRYYPKQGEAQRALQEDLARVQQEMRQLGGKPIGGGGAAQGGGARQGGSAGQGLVEQFRKEAVEAGVGNVELGRWSKKEGAYEVLQDGKVIDYWSNNAF